MNAELTQQTKVVKFLKTVTLYTVIQFKLMLMLHRLSRSTLSVINFISQIAHFLCSKECIYYLIIKQTFQTRTNKY